MFIQPHPARLERRKLHNPLFALVILKFTVLYIPVFCLPNLLSIQNKMGIKICLTGWDTCLHREVNQLCGMMWRNMICYGGLYIVYYCATGIRVLDVQRRPGENESRYPTMTRHASRVTWLCVYGTSINLNRRFVQIKFNRHFVPCYSYSGASSGVTIDMRKFQATTVRVLSLLVRLIYLFIRSK